MTPVSALQTVGVASVFLVGASLGGMLAFAAAPGLTSSGVAFWFFFLGASICLVGISMAVVMFKLYVRIIHSHQARVDDWHEVTIEAYLSNGGQEVTSETTAWELSASVPRDVVLFALSLHAMYEAGETTPHTVTKSTGQRWLGSAGSDLRLGDVNSSQAEQFSKLLPQLGLVEGREKRKPGEWVPRSYDDCIRLVSQNWPRVGAGS
jgi:hypothetical protein